MRRTLYTYLFLLTFSVLATGQVIDTTKAINTWELRHNFTRFEEVSLDTNMHHLHKEYQPAYEQGFSYEYLGILGHALNHVDFFLRAEPDAFLFGRAWEPYLKTPERTIFFNTKTPFTSISYSTIPVKQWREENIEVLHTQNMSPFTNFGIEFNILAGKELYTNEETRVNRLGLFGSHAKDRYSIFGTFYYNGFNRLEDHGGLEDLDAFLEQEYDNNFINPMNLTEAKSRYRNISAFVTHKYNLFERQVFTDTLGNTSITGKTLSLSHQFLFERDMKEYQDEVDLDNLSPVYTSYYYYHNSAQDSVSEDKLSNVFQVILGDPDYDKLSLRAYTGYEVRRFGMLSPYVYAVEGDSIERDTAEARFNNSYSHDVYVGLHLAGPTTGIWDWVIDGKYYLAGYYQNDFRIHATFSRELKQKADLGIRGSLELRKPQYFTQSYSSSFFQWDNAFPSMFRLKGEAFVQSEELELDIRAGAAWVSNYVYWDQQALPQVLENDLLILSGSFSKHFIFSGYHSDTKVLVQYTTADEVLRLPIAALQTTNYWKQALFKGALVADLGFDLYYTTKYKASAYMPATGVFYLQDAYDVGAYPFLDVFLAFRIQRTRIFVSYNNLLHGLGFVGNNYFTTYRYPMKPRHFRFGLVWTFYD